MWYKTQYQSQDQEKFHLCSLQEFYSFRSYVQIFYLKCILCKIRIQFHSFTWTNPISPAPFIFIYSLCPLHASNTSFSTKYWQPQFKERKQCLSKVSHGFSPWFAGSEAEKSWWKGPPRGQLLISWPQRSGELRKELGSTVHLSKLQVHSLPPPPDHTHAAHSATEPEEHGTTQA